MLTATEQLLLDQQREWRKRSRHRFPDPNLWLWSDRSLSQASDWMSASYKATLFPKDETVLDGCCGAGVDAVALAGRGPTWAVDCDPWMVALTESNALAHARRVDGFAESFSRESLRDVRWMHADPDRRALRGKTLDAEAFSPCLSELVAMARGLDGAVIKIAPSSRLDAPCETRLQADWIRVWLGSRGECQQQLLLTGSAIVDSFLTRAKSPIATLHGMAGPSRVAVVLQHSATEGLGFVESYFSNDTSCAPPLRHQDVSGSEMGPVIYDLNATLYASHLHELWADQHQLTPIGTEFGFYSGAQAVHSAWASCFELLDILPWDDRQVCKWLRSHDIGTVEVKSRLTRLDANIFQRRYSRPEGAKASLLVTRIGPRTRCMVCRRITSETSAP